MRPGPREGFWFTSLWLEWPRQLPAGVVMSGLATAPRQAGLSVGTLKRRLKDSCPSRLCRLRLPASCAKQVLLTFDDGPHPSVTAAVLDRLREFKAQAVFFVVGDRIPRAPAMLSRVLQQGHRLGNHTYTHPLDGRMPLLEYRRDLRRCQNAVYEVAGVFPKWHRPALGQISMASLLAPLMDGLSTVNWSCSTEDWQLRSADQAIERAKELGDRICDRDIILLHDEKSYTAVLLDHLLPVLVDRGFDLAPDLSGLA